MTLEYIVGIVISALLLALMLVAACGGTATAPPATSASTCVNAKAAHKAYLVVMVSCPNALMRSSNSANGRSSERIECASATTIRSSCEWTAAGSLASPP